METKNHSTNQLFCEFMNHLARKSIEYAGSDVNCSTAFQNITGGGWESSLEYVIACCDEILGRHTAFSWHYEPDEGVEEDRVWPERWRADFALKLGRKIQESNISLYSQEMLKMLSDGLGVGTHGFFGSDYYVGDVVKWGLDFLLENALDEATKNKIQEIIGSKVKKETDMFGNEREIHLTSGMTAEKYEQIYFSKE